MIVPKGILQKVDVWFFDPLKNIATVTKNRTYGFDGRFWHISKKKTVNFSLFVISVNVLSMMESICGPIFKEIP